MAKRRQTTGLPKAARPQPAAEEDKPSREYRSHAEREAEIQKWVLLATAGVVGFILVVIAAAFILDEVVNPARTVASVDSENFSAGEFEDRVRLERVITIERINAALNNLIDVGLTFDEAGQQVVSVEPYASLWQELNVRDQMGLRVLNDMIDDYLVFQEAERLGVSVSQDDIDAELREVLGYGDLEPLAVEDPEATEEPELTNTPTPTPLVSPTPSPEPTATNTPEIEPTATLTPFPTVAPVPTRTYDERLGVFEDDLDAFYDEATREANMSREDVNRIFEARALRKALSEMVVEPENTSVWVNARHILVETEDEALDIIDALRAGESFAALAQAKSTDTGSGAQGGELGWANTENYVTEFADATRELEIGAISDPVQSDFGFHIIQVREREDRDISEAAVDANREEAFDDWLDDLRDSEGYTVEISDIWPDYVPTDPPWVFEPTS
jgi:parvulin-like peptidyl-prolyl isomerase